MNETRTNSATFRRQQRLARVTASGKDAGIGGQQLMRYPDGPRTAAYVRACVVYAARSEIRRRVLHRRRRTPVGVDTESAESTVLLAAEHQIVVDAVRALPRRQREVVVLRYWQDLSEAEIAETLGISAGSVKSAASRGLDAVERYVQRRNR